MRAFQVAGAVVCCLSIVLSAPSRSKNELSNSDGSAEQELIRHHHATSDESQSSSEDDFDSSPIESVEEEPYREEELPRYEDYDEEDLYDITVSDVIKDVLSTLRVHPEIVKELIESEKEKLAARLAEVDQNEQEAELDDLADFQRPPQQLSMAPKAVEKKAGRSGMPVQADTGDVAKRQNEVIDENYPRSDVSEESREFHDFLNWPREGGDDDGMFGAEKSASINNHKVDVRDRHSAESHSESDEEQDSYRYSGPYNFAYPSPFLNRFGPPLDSFEQKGPGSFIPGTDPLSSPQQIWESHSVSEDSEETDTSNREPSDTSLEETNNDDDTSDSEIHTADTSLTGATSDNNESELTWLLHQTQKTDDKRSRQMDAGRHLV